MHDPRFGHGDPGGDALPGGIVLTHFFPECEGHDLAAMAAAHFDGEVVLGEDLMVLRTDRR